MYPTSFIERLRRSNINEMSATSRMQDIAILILSNWLTEVSMKLRLAITVHFQTSGLNVLKLFRPLNVVLTRWKLLMAYYVGIVFTLYY